MKKLFLTLVIALAAVVVNAQEHMKFQGISINGTFATLDVKLKQKGWVYDAKMSARIGPDQRTYKGSFAGQKGSLYVMRSNKSKTVFSISFFNEMSYSRSDANMQLEQHLASVRRAYPNATEWEPRSGDTQFDLTNGIIICRVIDYGFGTYSASIQYIDHINQQKYLSEIDSDY